MLVKKTSMPNPVKSLKYLTSYSSSGSDLLKAQAILSAPAPVAQTC